MEKKTDKKRIDDVFGFGRYGWSCRSHMDDSWPSSMRGAELMEKAKTFMQKPNLSQTLLELGTEWSDELEEVVRENRKSKAESNHEDSDMGKMIQEVLDDEQSES